MKILKQYVVVLTPKPMGILYLTQNLYSSLEKDYDGHCVANFVRPTHVLDT